MSSLHTAIPTSSFCSFWHGHPYIPIHFLKMFFILVYIILVILTLKFFAVSPYIYNAHIASRKSEVMAVFRWEYEPSDGNQLLASASVVALLSYCPDRNTGRTTAKKFGLGRKVVGMLCLHRCIRV